MRRGRVSTEGGIEDREGLQDGEGTLGRGGTEVAGIKPKSGQFPNDASGDE